MVKSRDYAQYYAHPLHPPVTTGYDAQLPIRRKS